MNNVQNFHALSNWYVLFTYANDISVKNTITAIVKRNDLGNIITDVVVPTCVETKILANGRKKVAIKSLMHSYVYVKITDLSRVQSILSNIRGVYGFVGSQGIPTPISREEALRLDLEKQSENYYRDFLPAA